ncbi:hypothetical protein Pst134EB_016364 [Puccinia striiformis f. sp. tritici]|nr:hypothetical protein Pst134EB_016364 [Puccinia striiformis f. sp. tritici]
MDGIPSVESIGEHLNIEQCSGTEGQELATWQCPTCQCVNDHDVNCTDKNYSG